MADPHKGRATSVWHLLVGPPRSAQGSGKERITPVEGLSALSLDALTSVAYGPEAIIVVVAIAGAARSISFCRSRSSSWACWRSSCSPTGR